MNLLRTSPTGRCLVVMLMLLSWLVITNHCALGQVQSRRAAGAAHAQCHAAQGATEKQAPGDGMRDCCRAVKACLADKSDAPSDLAMCQLEVLVVLHTFVAATVEPERSVLLDHGPPRAMSFAESVLQHCLPSHAPPRRA